jgi:hypothetical protein
VRTVVVQNEMDGEFRGHSGRVGRSAGRAA